MSDLKRFESDEERMIDEVLFDVRFYWERYRQPMPLGHTSRHAVIFRRLKTTGRAFLEWMQSRGLVVMAWDLNGGLHVYSTEVYAQFDDATKEAVRECLGPGMPTEFRQRGRARKMVEERASSPPIESSPVVEGVPVPIEPMALPVVGKAKTTMQMIQERLDAEKRAKAAAGDETDNG